MSKLLRLAVLSVLGMILVLAVGCFCCGLLSLCQGG